MYLVSMSPVDQYVVMNIFLSIPVLQHRSDTDTTCLSLRGDGDAVTATFY